jgi:hypothetical protein
MNVSSMVITMAINRLIFNRTKKSVTGLRTMEMMMANTMGITIPRAMYKAVMKANDPIMKMVAFA